MTIWIAPNCPSEVDAMIRADAAKRREQVFPTKPFPWNRRATDQRTVAERKWEAPTKARVPQLPADHGLFSDDHLQLDLVEMLQEPTNGD